MGRSKVLSALPFFLYNDGKRKGGPRLCRKRDAQDVGKKTIVESPKVRKNVGV